MGIAAVSKVRAERGRTFSDLLADNPRAAEVRHAVCLAARKSCLLRQRDGQLQCSIIPNVWTVINSRFISCKASVMLPYHKTDDGRCEWCGRKQAVDKPHKCNCALYNTVEVDASAMHMGKLPAAAPHSRNKPRWEPVTGLIRDTCVVMAPAIAVDCEHTVMLVAPCDLGEASARERGVYAMHALSEGLELVAYTGDVMTVPEAKKSVDREELSTAAGRAGAATMVDLTVKVVSGPCRTVVIRPVPFALCSLYNHSCDPNMVCNVDRAACTLQWKGAEIEMDTPVLKVVRDVCEGEELTWSYFYGQGKQEGGSSSIQCHCSVCRKPGAKPSWLF